MLTLGVVPLSPMRWQADLGRGDRRRRGSRYAVRAGPSRAGQGVLAVLAACVLVLDVLGKVRHLQTAWNGTSTAPVNVVQRKPFGSPSETHSLRVVSLVRRTCAWTRCRVLARLPDGTSVLMRCWVTGEYLGGRYRSARWLLFRLKEGGHKLVGYIHSADVIGQALAPQCRRRP